MATLHDLQYKFTGAHIYEDIVLTSVFPRYKVDEARKFEFSPVDVIVATYPKSGTTWVQEVTWLLLNKCDFAKAESTPLDARSPFLELEEYQKCDEETPLAPPRVFKTHLKQNWMDDTIETHNPRVVVVMRNPKDVLVSQYHFYQMNKAYDCFNGTWDEFYDLFQRKELEFGYWYEHVNGWWEKLGNKNYHFVMYEEMKKNPYDTFKGLADFLQVAVSKAELEEIVKHTMFGKMKANKMLNFDNDSLFDLSISKFMRKGVVGDWRNYFSQEQSNFMDTLCADLKEQGLVFSFE